MEYDLNNEEEGNSRIGALRDKDSQAGRQEGSLRKPRSNSGKAAQRFSPGDFQHTGQERVHSQGDQWLQPECVVKRWGAKAGLLSCFNKKSCGCHPGDREEGRWHRASASQRGCLTLRAPE